MLLRLSSVFVSLTMVLIGSNPAEAGQRAKRTVRCVQPMIYRPSCGNQTCPIPACPNGVTQQACGDDSCQTAPATSSAGEWRTEQRTQTIERVLPDGTRVQETKQVQVRSFVPNSQLIQEQRSSIDSLKQQLDSIISQFDAQKANKVDVEAELDKKQDKPAPPNN